MIVIFCMLIVLGLGYCEANDLPSRSEIENSINRTIEEVERMIREDPGLPRLSRQQIVNILYNITSQELNSYKDRDQIQKAREMYQKALMVVLPYNAEDSSGNLNDLYTKPPMTQIIPDTSKAGEIESDAENKSREVMIELKNTDNTDDDSTTSSSSENLVSHKSMLKDYQSTTVKNRYKNHRETYSEVRTKAPLKESLKLDSAPVKFSFNLENLQKSLYTTEKSTAEVTKRPVFYKDRHNGNKKTDSKMESTYSTSTTVKPTVKSDSEETVIHLDGLKLNQNVLSSDQWMYNAPPSTTSKSITSFKSDKHRESVTSIPSTIKMSPQDGMFVSSAKKSETFGKISKIPPKAAPIISSERPPLLYVTPMFSESTEKPKYGTTHSLNSGGFLTATSTVKPMREEVIDLLASIGLRPHNGSNVEDIYKKNKDLLENKYQIPHTNSVIHATTSGLNSIAPSSTSIANQNTFESPGSQIKKGVENLSPDVQLLFQRFGLQTSNFVDASITSTQRSTVSVNSYTNFKPLPTSNVKDQDMKEFLARFGLGVNNREQKAISATTKTPSLVEVVPNNMRNILENMGLITKTHKKPITSKTREDMEPTETTKYHVFKPHEVIVKDENQRLKINQLLDTVKMVQEGKANVQDVQRVANDLLDTTRRLKDGPDPLSLEEIIRIYNEDIKNEVKRQQQQQDANTTDDQLQNDSSATSTTESISAVDTTSTTTSTMTDSAKAASDLLDSLTTTSESSGSSTSAVESSTSSNLLALEESFGGTTREPDPVIPTRKKSGLYFLLDWNSFLEVGEEEQGKVNLRFEPKIGDRSRFLPVTVP